MNRRRLTELISDPRAPLAAAAALLTVGAIVRLIDINRYGFNSDEAVYAGQAAALAGEPGYADLFGVFRAHPLLVQFSLAIVYKVIGVNDLAPRLITIVAGIGLILVAGAFARGSGGRAAGLIALMFAALCPYAITVSRQFLLDGPMALFSGLCLVFLAEYSRKPRRSMLLAAAAAAGLAFLSKETAILLVPTIVLFFLLCPSVPVSLGDAARAIGVYVLAVAPFPLSLLLGGGNRVVGQYAAWQILRRPNHTPDFYLTVLPDLGPVIVALALVGLYFAARRRQPADVLLLCFMAVTITFFQLWPVKGYQYLIAIVVPTTVLAADGLLNLARVAARVIKTVPPVSLERAQTALVAGSAIALMAGVLGALAPPAVVVASSDEPAAVGPQVFLAGTGGLEAGRPAGLWVGAHTPVGSRFLTIGPSFANVIQFYGRRQAQALSVSPNPLHRNPSYEPVINPDLEIRNGRFQYLVYDAYSASRSPYFAGRLRSYVTKHSGTPVYKGMVSTRAPDGRLAKVATVIIYEVHP
jgi:4-amino-4-deoxy-L-arabinose transferase-like glycosyltransferase